jgi:HEAT repeat protein
MRLPVLASCLALSLAALSAAGCHRDHARSPADVYAKLQSPDADERRDAADDLMDDDGPRREDVPYLVAAIQHEQNPKTYGVMLLALGKSGAPEAKPYIEANLHNPNKDVRQRAERALEAWSRKNPYGVRPPPQALPPEEAPAAAEPPTDPAAPPPPLPPPTKPSAPPPEGQSI